MTGFFSSKETESKTRPGGKKYSCIACGLIKNVEMPRIEPFGEFKKKILLIGESPNETDISKDELWTGRHGRTVRKALEKLGVDIYEDCTSINAVNCLPLTKAGDLREPKQFEIECCRKIVVDKVIANLKPKVIILLGEAALESVVGKRWKKGIGTMAKWHGAVIPDQDLKCWVCPTWHPSEVEHRNEDVALIWKMELESAIKMVNVAFPVYKEPKIHYLDDITGLYSIVKRYKRVVTDIEATGLKPHAEGHKIVCASIAVSPDEVYVFMMPDKLKDCKPYIDILQDENIEKMGHNIKYEDTWFNVILKAEVKNWGFDSMLAAHVLDNREGIVGLKFQTFIKLGIPDYDSEISPYLKGDDKNANSFNKILELISTEDGRHKLMKYCALDSINEYRLANLQMEIMDDQIPF